MTKAIDVHCHLSTRPQYEAWGPYLEPMERYYKFRPEVRSEGEMVEELRRADVRACIIGWDAAAGSGGPPLTNDYVADLVRRFPETFPGGWAMIDPWRGREALREAERCLTSLGLMGIKFQATAQAFFPDDHRFYPLYDLCQSLGKAVQFHSGTTGFGAGTPGGMGLKLKYCRPIPHLDDVAADFPGLTIIACHPSWPWQDEMIAVCLHKANVLDGDVGLVAQVLLRGPQARDPRPAPGPGDVRLGLPGAELRAALPRLGVRGLPGRGAGEGLPPERRADPRASAPERAPAATPRGRPRPPRAVAPRYNERVTPMLEARGLVKHLGGRRVVDGVDLVCQPGQIHGLLGPNGAGKTTTLRMLYGFLTPDAGAILFDGVDARGDLARAKRSIGVCTQDDTFDGDFTVEQNLLDRRRVLPAAAGRPRASAWPSCSSASSCGPYARQKPETLSGGYRRRLMIARALVHRPRLLFLDEPTTGLDPQARMAVWELVDGLRAEGLGDRPHHALHGRGRAAERRAHRAGPRPRGRARHAEGRAGRLGGRARRRGRGAGGRRGRRCAVARRRAGSASRRRVLGDWHVPLSAEELAEFARAFPHLRYEVRGPDARRSVPQAGARAMIGRRRLRAGRVPTLRWLAAALEWQSRAVVVRHLRVYLRNWHTAFLPPVFEPVTMLLAFGLGPRRLRRRASTWQGRPWTT